MRLATLTLVMLWLLSVGTILAVAQGQPANVSTVPYVATASNGVVVTPVRRYSYKPAPGWYGYHRSPPYYTYRPRAYWYGPSRYYGYYADPYPRYYYPGGFGFEYRGPRASFGFGF